MRLDLTRIREQVGNVRSDFTVLVGVGVLVGIGSGCAGLLLHFGLHGARDLWDHDSPLAHVLAVILPALGAGLAWLFLHHTVRERVHGIGELIWIANREGGRMPLRAIFSQMVGSWLTVGFGGSAGPEGPIAYSGAAVGSNIAQIFGLSERRRISLLGCGVAGAISSIFNAPVTGLLFALEVVLGEWVSVNILPIAISSVVANVLASTVRPGAPIFHLENTEFFGYADYPAVIGLGILAGLGSTALLRAIAMSGRVFRAGSRPALWKPMLGGLLVGLLGLEFPRILAEGYAAIRQTFTGEAHDIVWAIGLVAVMKIIATALTLGSGGCGGIFAPALFIGAYLGLFYRELLATFGLLEAGVHEHAALYALIGMAGMLGGTLLAPLSAIFLVAEITGNYNLLLPLILVTACSTIVAQRLQPAGIYGRELEERHGSSKAVRIDARILADISLAELAVPADTVLREDQSVDTVQAEVAHSDHDLFPVVDPDGKYAGVLRAHFLFGHDAEVRRFLLVSDVMEADWPSAREDTPIETLLPLFDQVAVIPLVDVQGRLKGMITARKLLLRYRQELLIQTTR